MTKTSMVTAKDIKRAWHLVDLDGQTLGRAATRIATLLIGKHKPTYVPHLDCGDYVVIINAAKVKVTGTKTTDKIYRHHTMHPGGFREIPYEKMMAKDPRKIITLALSGMIPHNKLHDPRLKRLKVFVGATHPYAQQLGLVKETKEG